MSMRKIDYLVSRLRTYYPQFKFEQGQIDHWASSSKTIYFNPKNPQVYQIILHELSHALLDHKTYRKDIELLSMERDAWGLAQNELSSKFNILIDEDTVQNHLDTYRDWLHDKSACPVCDQTGVQIDSVTYKCMGCFNKWKVNVGMNERIHRYIKTN